MGSKQRARNIRFSARLVVITSLLLLATGYLSGQEPPRLTMELSADLVTQGDRITIELFVPGSDPDELTFLLPSLPDRLSLVGEPLLTESRRLVNNSVLSGTLIILQLQAGTPGRTVLPPMRIEGLGMEPLETQEQLIGISLDGTEGGVPFDLRWRIDDPRVLVGETLPLYLEMQNMLDLRYPEAINLESPESAVFEEVRGLGEVRSRRAEETTLYDVPVAVFLVTPTQEGTLRIPSASVTLGDLTRESAPLGISAERVEAQPDSGAIGVFEFATELSQREGELTDRLAVTLRISGRGNLPFLSFPPVTVENLIELDRQEEIRQVPSEAGYEGERTLTLRFSPGEGTRASLEVGTFDFLDPEEGRLRSIPAEQHSFTLPAPGTVVTSGAERELTLVPVQEILAEEAAFSYRDSSSYLLFLVGPGILLVVGVSVILQRRKAVPAGAALFLIALLTALPLIGQSDSLEERLRRGERLFESGAYAEALASYQSLREDLPHNASLFHNYGVAAYLLGSRGEAIHGLREAVRLDQGDRSHRLLLESVEEEYGLEQQIEVPWFIDPNTALIGLLLLFNAGLPLVVLLPFRVRGQRVIFGTLFVILSALGTLLFLQAERIENQGRGVVRSGQAQMLRIPEPDADAWLTLSEGTAVQVELRHQEFVLVRTGLGVEGWLSAEQLLLGARRNG